MELREKEFYQITKQKGVFKVWKNKTVVFKIECEELIQCDTALIAKYEHGMSEVYLPVLVNANEWNFKAGFVRVMERVKEFYYYRKQRFSFNSGLLLLKVENLKNIGYWTAFTLECFEWNLTPERMETRKESLPRVTYNGFSSATIMKEFDYLPIDKYLIKVNERIYLVDNENRGAVYSATSGMTIKDFGRVKVEPIPFRWYFKVRDSEGEVFYNCSGNENAQNFGPYFKIEAENREKLKAVLGIQPSCYFAKNKKGNIVAMFLGRKSDDDEGFYKYESIVTFPFPFDEAEFIMPVKTNKSTVATWKLCDLNGEKKILLYSIFDKDDDVILLDVSAYL